MYKKPLGYIAYEGPSLLDGRPIVVIINKINTASANDKTGALVQSFIIRSDVDPVTALKTGDDASICGDCIHRPITAKESGQAPCYVNVGRSVLAVYKAHLRGRYAKIDTETLARELTGKNYVLARMVMVQPFPRLFGNSSQNIRPAMWATLTNGSGQDLIMQPGLNWPWLARTMCTKPNRPAA